MKPSSPARAPLLTYCTNVHPGETLSEVMASLDRFAVPLRATLAADPESWVAADPFALGLYMSAATARELADPVRRATFGEFLARRSLSIATLNCFPFGGFHRDVVKLDVYRPTWIEDARVAFTLMAARAVAELVPEGAVVPISTVAGSCKRFADPNDAAARIARNLGVVAAGLERLRVETGREVLLCLEPEPFSTLETSHEAASFFRAEVFGAAGQRGFTDAGGAEARAEAALRRHIGLCFDTCHQAVEFEAAADALQRIDAAGIRIGKLQLSSALAVRDPGEEAGRLAALATFAEPRYLHQGFVRRRDGSLDRVLDLPELLSWPQKEWRTVAEARVHFHVPIDRAELGVLGTTRSDLVESVAAVRALGLPVPVFEVETYTFPLLPAGPQGGDALVAALAQELRFARGL